MATSSQQSPATGRLIDVKEWAAMEGETSYELVEGRLVEKPDVALWHDFLLMRLARRLAQYLEDHRLGEVVTSAAKVKISAMGGRMPDIMFLPFAMYDLVGKNLFKGVPPLVIEILSPSTERTDRVAKRREYAGLGIGQYWIVDLPARTVEVYELRDDAYALAATAEGNDVFRPSLFPGLEIPLDAVWPVEFEHRTDD